jgi:hypothetical protein
MHSQTILALLASAATLVSSSPLVRRATCPPVDNNNSTLVSQGLDGNFVLCIYESAGRCTYFSNGGFSSGGSVCPDRILNGDDGDDNDVTATCPETDDTGSALLSSAVEDGEVVCYYEKAGFCSYFTNGGFSSGSSDCPDSAISKKKNKVKARETEAAVEKRAASCPEVDNNGSPLLSSGPASDPRNGIRCVYQQARTCIYFSNGSFSSGSSVCPTSISNNNNFKVREANAAPGPVPAPLPKTEDNAVEKRASCPAVDNNGSPLLSSRRVSDPPRGIRCVYKQARFCTYFSNGSFSSGSSICPTSI